MLTLSIQMLTLLFLVAMLAGFVDAIAGGGGLLTIPALLLSGIPPVSALATNKLQACAGSFSASLMMIKRQIIKPANLKIALLMAFIGSALGTLTVQFAKPELLKWLIPILIAIIGLYTLFSPNLGKLQQKPRISQSLWQKTFVPLIGFYDGYLGPATGTFFALCGVRFRGLTLLEATATAKLLNFATNIASLLFFILGGHVLWTVGFVMMAGQIIGAFLDSFTLIKGNTQLIRPMIVLMCLAMVVRYTWSMIA